MSEIPQSRFARTSWELGDGSRIQLIQPAELATLAAGTVLRCIDGTSAVVGKDAIDGDTRGGYLAFGFADPTPPAAPRPCDEASHEWRYSRPSGGYVCATCGQEAFPVADELAEAAPPRATTAPDSANYLHVVEGSFVPYGVENALRHLRAKLPLESGSWNCIDEEFRRLERDAARMREALEDIAQNWDHDSDAHKYGTVCRVCQARAALTPSGEPTTTATGATP